MIFLWLVVWLLCGTPRVDFAPVNDWAIALTVCVVLALLNTRSDS